MKAFLRFLAACPVPPACPAELRVGHVQRFIQDRTRDARQPVYGLREVENVASVLRLEPIASCIAAAMHAEVRPRGQACRQRR